MGFMKGTGADPGILSRKHFTMTHQAFSINHPFRRAVFAFQTAEDAGFFHNPALPFEVSRAYIGGTAYGLELSGNYAYLALNGFGLRVFDISNPADPVEVGYYETGGKPYNLAVDGYFV